MIVLTLALVSPAAAWAQGHPDFSGKWKLDPAKSDPPPNAGRAGGGGGGGGGANEPIQLIQDDKEFKVHTDTRQNGPQTVTYKLDGSESVNEVMAGGESTTTKSVAKWDGAKLVIVTHREYAGAQVTLTETRWLEGDDLLMTTNYSGGPNNGLTRKVIYHKVQ
jgi:hypothetical protein